MKVLVVGGCGFIGSHVVDALLADGHRVRVLDRSPELFRAPLPLVDYLYGDFADRACLTEALRGIDVVFHLASTTFPGTADRDPALDVSQNLLGTLGLVETMLANGVSRLLFLSSGGTVYGVPQTLPIAEDHPLRPTNSYGIVKATIEHYLAMYGRARGLSSIVLRASNPYGPRQGHTGVQGLISTVLRCAAEGSPVTVWGDGSVVRDYMDVADLARLCALSGPSEVVGAFNVGSGEGHSVMDVLQIVRDVTGRAFEVRHEPARAVDVPVSVLDPTKARDTFDWTCRHSLENGIRRNWTWLLHQEGHTLETAG